MKIRLILASLLLFATAFVHAWGGELTDIKALAQSGIAEIFEYEIRAVWHAISIDFASSALILAWLISKNRWTKYDLLYRPIGWRMMLYGLVFLFVVLTQDVTRVLALPQWALLFTIGLLLVLPTRKNKLETQPHVAFN
jgi:hypothetical protein